MKKIIILGAGQVGSSVAAHLASEDNDITVIDLNEEPLKLLADRYDLRTVTGNAAHPSVLLEAGIQDCELLIAVTEVDEVNMLACRIAHVLFQVPDRVARIRAAEYFSNESLSDGSLFDISHMICPEQVVSDYLLKLVEFPEALQVLEFANDRVRMVAVRARDDGLLVGKPISDLSRHLPNIDARIVAIFRENGSLRPDGQTIIRTGDEVFVLSERDDMRKVMQELRKMDRPVKRVMIGGGSDVGFRLASALEKRKLNVKLIEPDKDRAKVLAGSLHGTLVLNASEADAELLDTEGVAEVDLYVAATNNDERNIIAALLAKRMGANRVVVLIHKTEYVDLLEDSKIDIVIGLAETSIGDILSHIRRADVDAAHSLRRGASEVLEVIAHGDHATSQVVGRRVDEINWPSGALLGAIVRQEEVLMAHHDEVIRAEDHLVIFVTDKKIIPRVERLLQVSGLFI
jgi:trk system potassium uptake protein TrkA